MKTQELLSLLRKSPEVKVVSKVIETVLDEPSEPKWLQNCSLLSLPVTKPRQGRGDGRRFDRKDF